MINAIIEFSARNRFVVFLLVAVAVVAGVWSMRTVPLDAIPGPQRHAGHRLLALGPQPGHRRRPGHLSDRHRDARRAEGEGGPRLLRLRLLVRLRHVRGGHRHLLGALAHAGYLSGVLPRLPQGVRTELGPDATGVGWVFQYALVDTTGRHSLDELRSYQDWYLRYYLKSVPGVAEVAPLGGFVRQYQVQVDPNRLRAFNIPIGKVVDAVRAGNNDVGGRLVEMSGAEYMVRGRGYAKINGRHRRHRARAKRRRRARSACATSATVTLGPDIRRGVADLDGTGDVVAGIVVMRQGENALNVIERVKAKLKDLEPVAAAGREGRDDLRPLRADPALDRQPEAHADRGAADRLR